MKTRWLLASAMRRSASDALALNAALIQQVYGEPIDEDGLLAEEIENLVRQVSPVARQLMYYKP